MMISLILCARVYASDISSTWEEAKKAFEKKEYNLMEKHLGQYSVLMEKHTSLVTPESLSRPWMLRAAAKYQQEKELIWEFRNALIVNPYMDWDDTYIQNNETRDLFYAVKSEIEYRQKTKTFVPEQYGLAKLYVDGVEVEYGSEVPRGEHLLQIQCPKGEVVSKWHTLAKNPKWVQMCPYKFDVTEISEEVDEFMIEGIPSVFAEETPQDITEKTDVRTEPSTEEIVEEIVEEETSTEDKATEKATEEIVEEFTKEEGSEIKEDLPIEKDSLENISTSGEDTDVQTNVPVIEIPLAEPKVEEAADTQEKIEEKDSSVEVEEQTSQNEQAKVQETTKDEAVDKPQLESTPTRPIENTQDENTSSAFVVENNDTPSIDKDVRKQNISVQLYSGFSFGDVRHRYDARVGLTPDLDVYGVYEYESWISGGSVFQMGASVGYFPMSWLEVSLYTGLSLYPKELSTGWEIQDASGTMLEEDEVYYDPALSSLLHVEPRMKLYLFPSGTFKPYVLGGVFFRSFDGYSPPKAGTVTYSEQEGGMHVGISGGLGLVIESSAPVYLVLELPYMQLLNASMYERSEVSENTPNNTIENLPYYSYDDVDSYPVSTNRIISFQIGLGLHF